MELEDILPAEDSKQEKESSDQAYYVYIFIEKK